jgi:hypothetical protein
MLNQCVKGIFPTRWEGAPLPKKETAAPAGPRNGGEIGVGKPSTQKLYRALSGWIKPGVGSSSIKLSAAAAMALGFHTGGAR